MTTSISPRAVLFAEQGAFASFLRTFLFKHKLRETLITDNPDEIVSCISQNQWPIIFIDHAEGKIDAMLSFEKLISRPGFEMLSYIFIAPAEFSKYPDYTQSVGASGWLAKPIEPPKADTLIRNIQNLINKKSCALALQASRLILQGMAEKAIPMLENLLTTPEFAKSAAIALARQDMENGLFSKAKGRLTDLLNKHGKEIRILCEISRYYLKLSQPAKAVKFFDEIRQRHSDLTLMIWPHLETLTEIDDIDTVSQILLELQRKPFFADDATEYFSRLMYQFGLQEHIPNALRTHPNIVRRYNQFLASQTNTA